MPKAAQRLERCMGFVFSSANPILGSSLNPTRELDLNGNLSEMVLEMFAMNEQDNIRHVQRSLDSVSLSHTLVFDDPAIVLPDSLLRTDLRVFGISAIRRPPTVPSGPMQGIPI